jgi:hypothetical protein
VSLPEWSLGNEMPAFALGAAHVDACTKGHACRIDAKHATEARKTPTHRFPFLIHGWRDIDVFCPWPPNNVSRFLGWRWGDWTTVTLPAEDYGHNRFQWNW